MVTRVILLFSQLLTLHQVFSYPTGDYVFSYVPLDEFACLSETDIEFLPVVQGRVFNPDEFEGDVIYIDEGVYSAGAGQCIYPCSNKNTYWDVPAYTLPLPPSFPAAAVLPPLTTGPATFSTVTILPPLTESLPLPTVTVLPSATGPVTSAEIISSNTGPVLFPEVTEPTEIDIVILEEVIPDLDLNPDSYISYPSRGYPSTQIPGSLASYPTRDYPTLNSYSNSLISYSNRGPNPSLYPYSGDYISYPNRGYPSSGSYPTRAPYPLVNYPNLPLYPSLDTLPYTTPLPLSPSTVINEYQYQVYEETGDVEIENAVINPVIGSVSISEPRRKRFCGYVPSSGGVKIYANFN